MNQPTLTIITTSLNRRALLQKTLDSVLRQSYPAIEQLVIDAVSQDGTVELLQEYESRFRRRGMQFRWFSELDSGQGEAMNKGLRRATGEFVMILNSDDFLNNDVLATFMTVLEQDPTIDFIYGNHDTLYEDGRRFTVVHHLYSLRDILRNAYQIPQSSAIFRHSFIDRVGGFDESLRHVAEHELFVRLVKAGARLQYLPVVLQVTLEHAGRKTTVHAARSWRETKEVNFRHGGGYFSRFYVLYLKNVYFNWLFEAIRGISPRVYGELRKLFNRITSSR